MTNHMLHMLFRAHGADIVTLALQVVLELLVLLLDERLRDVRDAEDGDDGAEVAHAG